MSHTGGLVICSIFSLILSIDGWKNIYKEKKILLPLPFPKKPTGSPSPLHTIWHSQIFFPSSISSYSVRPTVILLSKFVASFAFLGRVPYEFIPPDPPSFFRVFEEPQDLIRKHKSNVLTKSGRVFPCPGKHRSLFVPLSLLTTTSSFLPPPSTPDRL